MDETESQVQAEPEKQQLHAWATKAGHLPVAFEGDKLHPTRHNPKAWVARAVCARLGAGLDSEITEETYTKAAADVSAVDAR